MDNKVRVRATYHPPAQVTWVTDADQDGDPWEGSRRNAEALVQRLRAAAREGWTYEVVGGQPDEHACAHRAAARRILHSGQGPDDASSVLAPRDAVENAYHRALAWTEMVSDDLLHERVTIADAAPLLEHVGIRESSEGMACIGCGATSTQSTQYGFVHPDCEPTCTRHRLLVLVQRCVAAVQPSVVSAEVVRIARRLTRERGDSDVR